MKDWHIPCMVLALVQNLAGFLLALSLHIEFDQLVIARCQLPSPHFPKFLTRLLSPSTA
jgi:hypothetical protein